MYKRVSQRICVITKPWVWLPQKEACLYLVFEKGQQREGERRRRESVKKGREGERERSFIDDTVINNSDFSLKFHNLLMHIIFISVVVSMIIVPIGL